MAPKCSRHTLAMIGMVAKVNTAWSYSYSPVNLRQCIIQITTIGLDHGSVLRTSKRTRFITGHSVSASSKRTAANARRPFFRGSRSQDRRSRALNRGAALRARHRTCLCHPARASGLTGQYGAVPSLASVPARSLPADCLESGGSRIDHLEIAALEVETC